MFFESPVKISSKAVVSSGMKGSVTRDSTSSIIDDARLERSDDSGDSNANASEASDEISSAKLVGIDEAAVKSVVVAMIEDRVAAKSLAAVAVSDSSRGEATLDAERGEDDRELVLGSGRYLTHQNASQSPLSMTRFLTMYATTRRKNAREERMRSRSSQSAFSRDIMRFLEVVRRVPNVVYRSEVLDIVLVDSSRHFWTRGQHNGIRIYV